MNYDEFIKEVQTRGHMESHEEAEIAKYTPLFESGSQGEMDI